MSKHTPMGIGLLGDTGVRFIRKFRWTFKATFPSHTIQEGFVKIHARPVPEIEDPEINFLSSKTWIPGKATWSTLTTTHWDINPDDFATTALFHVLREGWEKLEKKEPQEEGTGVLTLYDGCGTPIETFTLDGLTIQGMNFGDFGSSDTDMEVTWQYKTVAYKNLMLPSVESADGQVEPLLGSKTE